MTVLVTGGAGYIGSHATAHLLRDGRRVVVVDNLHRGHMGAVERLASRADGRLVFVKGDVGDRELMTRTIRDHGVKSVMHFAALTYVGESVSEPLRYYRNNASAALSLLEACDEGGVERFVFSSTCATYGEPDEQYIPIPEVCPQRPISPYGQSKLHMEHMLRDHTRAAASASGPSGGARPFGFAALRYFNVAGCDRSGLLGEHHDPETHLIPVILQVVLGQREALHIFGTDYPTPDGTCIRDYVHVEDLAAAHIRVLDAIKAGDQRAYNLGIGRGYSVREIVDSVKRVTGQSFRIVEGPRRAGDPPRLFADPSLVRRDVNWRAEITNLDDIVRSAWDWFRRNPTGYSK